MMSVVLQTFTFGSDWDVIPLTDDLAWVVIGLFLASVVVDAYSRRGARYVAAVAWAMFAGFWALLIPHFVFVQNSAVEGVLMLIAVPACLYAAVLLIRGRDFLFRLSRAVAFMGVVYLPFTMMPALRQPLIETVTRQVEYILTFLGYQFEVGPDRVYGYRAGIYFEQAGTTYRTNILLACTGIGSLSIFAGIIAAARASLARKAAALAVSTAIIWILNLVRVTFITLAFSKQWFQFYVSEVMGLTGLESEANVSSFFAEQVISQSLSVVALVVLAWLTARILPEILTIGEDALYLLTGSEYDLYEAFGRSKPMRTDGK